jgi:hypothetical protein
MVDDSSATSVEAALDAAEVLWFRTNDRSGWLVLLPAGPIGYLLVEVAPFAGVHILFQIELLRSVPKSHAAAVGKKLLAYRSADGGVCWGMPENAVWIDTSVDQTEVKDLAVSVRKALERLYAAALLRLPEMLASLRGSYSGHEARLSEEVEKFLRELFEDS